MCSSSIFRNYDRFDLVLFLKACNVLEYLRVPLLLSDGHRSSQIPVASGLVATLARALLHRALHDHHNRCPKLVVPQFVGDLKMFAEGPDKSSCVQIQPACRGVVHSLWQS